MPVNKRREGSRGEKLAAEHLERNGYRIIERNYRFDRGEIDLIAEDGDELVFIEVKSRRSDAFGPPEDAITPQKQEQIKRVAEGYLFERQIEERACRFDVVAITFNHGKADIRVIRNAF
jgi:putative endonuclease